MHKQQSYRLAYRILSEKPELLYCFYIYQEGIKKMILKTSSSSHFHTLERMQSCTKGARATKLKLCL
jgi:hypothetical protein